MYKYILYGWLCVVSYDLIFETLLIAQHDYVHDRHRS